MTLLSTCVTNWPCLGPFTDPTINFLRRVHPLHLVGTAACWSQNSGFSNSEAIAVVILFASEQEKYYVNLQIFSIFLVDFRFTNCFKVNIGVFDFSSKRRSRVRRIKVTRDFVQTLSNKYPAKETVKKIWNDNVILLTQRWSGTTTFIYSVCTSYVLRLEVCSCRLPTDFQIKTLLCKYYCVTEITKKIRYVYDWIGSVRHFLW